MVWCFLDILCGCCSLVLSIFVVVFLSFVAHGCIFGVSLLLRFLLFALALFVASCCFMLFVVAVCFSPVVPGALIVFVAKRPVDPALRVYRAVTWLTVYRPS